MKSKILIYTIFIIFLSACSSCTNLETRKKNHKEYVYKYKLKMIKERDETYKALKNDSGLNKLLQEQSVLSSHVKGFIAKESAEYKNSSGKKQKLLYEKMRKKLLKTNKEFFDIHEKHRIKHIEVLDYLGFKNPTFKEMMEKYFRIKKQKY